MVLREQRNIVVNVFVYKQHRPLKFCSIFEKMIFILSSFLWQRFYHIWIILNNIRIIWKMRHNLNSSPTKTIQLISLLSKKNPLKFVYLARFMKSLALFLSLSFLLARLFYVHSLLFLVLCHIRFVRLFSVSFQRMHRADTPDRSEQIFSFLPSCSASFSLLSIDDDDDTIA
jgi:hypothetical protein